jgi:hypothetical protein
MAQGVIDAANEVHDQLLKLVAPASPASIRASSLRLSRNPTLCWICILAGIFFIIFVVPIFITALSGDGSNRTNFTDLKDLLQIVGGAGLGSAFYALYTASDYIKTSTFDPKYNATYSIRFLLGVLSGLILAYFLKDLIRPDHVAGGNTGGAGGTNANGNQIQLYNIGVAALALIGGYAAEAVARILDRLSETLVTLVSGSDKDKLDAEKQKAQADAQLKTVQTNSDTARKIQKALAQPDMPKAIRDVLDDLLK